MKSPSHLVQSTQLECTAESRPETKETGQSDGMRTKHQQGFTREWIKIIMNV